MARAFDCVVAVAGLFLLGCTGGGGGCGYREPEDNDRDGWTDDEDCDDQDASRNPGEDERCNGQDDDCDFDVDEDAVDADETHADDDGDGYGDPDATTWDCDPPSSYVTNGRDCDDHDASAHPGGEERCDGADNDCDGDVDEDAASAPAWWADADGDGYGDPALLTPACEAPDGYVANMDDCDDASSDVRPGAIEACGTSRDEDCQPETPDECGYTLRDTSTAAATLLGRTEDEGAGGALAGVGDVDGDGYDDLLVGAAGSGSGTEGAYWVRGPLSGELGLALADAHLEGSGAGVGAGSSVAGAGDVDDDGYTDVLVGAPQDTDGATAGGAAWLFYGPDLAGCDPFCDGAVFYATAAGARVGASVAGAGDVDGDGYDDVLLGAPGLAAGGGAYLVTGTPSDAVSLADADAELVGEGSGRAGERVYAPGDVDGDGYDDLAVLDPVEGVVWIVTGRPSGVVPLAESSARIVAPVSPNASFTSAALGDLDGDGVLDVMIGTSVEEEVSSDAVAWAAFGPLVGAVDLATPDVTVVTGGVYANAGVEVVVGPDLDRDGADDLLFLANSSTAMLAPDYTVRLDLSGSAFYSPGPLASGSWSLGDAATRFGTPTLEHVSGAFVGDLNADGREDVAVGDERDDTDDTNAGAVWILSRVGL